MVDDAALKEQIISALEWAEDIDLAMVGVSVSERLVTLFGQVTSHRQRQTLDQAVLQVRGVAAVTNEIQVVRAEYRGADRCGERDAKGLKTASRPLAFRRLRSVNPPGARDANTECGVARETSYAAKSFRRAASAVAHRAREGVRLP